MQLFLLSYSSKFVFKEGQLYDVERDLRAIAKLLVKIVFCAKQILAKISLQSAYQRHKVCNMYCRRNIGRPRVLLYVTVC